MAVVAFVAPLLVVMIIQADYVLRRCPRLLDQWAEDRRLQVVERRYICQTDGRRMTHGFSQGGSIYRLVLRDRGGRLRKAMACIAGPLHPRPSPIEILWDAFNEPACDDFAG